MLVRAPGFGGNAYNQGDVVVVLKDWGERRPADAIIGEINGKLSDLPGVRAVAMMRQGLAGGGGKPVQFVLGGPSYEQVDRMARQVSSPRSKRTIPASRISTGTIRKPSHNSACRSTISAPPISASPFLTLATRCRLCSARAG